MILDKTSGLATNMLCCFTERDSRKDEAVVFIFIFATGGLLAWAAVKPWAQKWLEVFFLYPPVLSPMCSVRFPALLAEAIKYPKLTVHGSIRQQEKGDPTLPFRRAGITDFFALMITNSFDICQKNDL